MLIIEFNNMRSKQIITKTGISSTAEETTAENSQ
jgi:hypothetical protein